MPTKPLIGRDTRLCMSLAARPGNFGTRFHNRLYETLGPFATAVFGGTPMFSRKGAKARRGRACRGVDRSLT